MAEEVTALRSRTSKTYALLDGKHKFVGGLTPLHFGTANDPVDFTPQATIAPLDGWKVTQADYTYSVGRKAGQDGWFGFGGLEGQNTIFFRLARMGYIHWPSKSFDNLSGAPNYNRANLTNNVENFDTGEELLPVSTKASWGNIWSTPNNGEVSIDVNANGERLKLDVILNQSGREWIAANRPPTTQVSQTYFGMVFQLDLTDIPKIVRNGITQNQDTDFDDLDDLPTELRDDLDNLLAFMPVDYAYAGSKGDEQKVKLTKRFWKDADGKHYLLVGAKVADINSLPAGDIRFDPTFGAAQISANDRDGQQVGTGWYVSGWDTDGSIIHYANWYMANAWTNVTIPSGATVSSATMDWYCAYENKDTGVLDLTLTGCDEDNVAAFGAANLPASIAKTTAKLDWAPAGSVFNDNSWTTTPDISALVQEVFDRAAWASGNALGIVTTANTNATDSLQVQIQDYGRDTTLAAKITIVYTTGGGGATGKSNPIYGPLGGPLYGVIS